MQSKTPTSEEAIAKRIDGLMSHRLTGALVGRKIDKDLGQNLPLRHVDVVFAGLYLATINWVASGMIATTKINWEDQRAVFLELCARMFDEAALLGHQFQHKDNTK